MSFIKITVSITTTTLRRAGDLWTLFILITFMTALMLTTTSADVINLYIGRDNVKGDEVVFDLLNKYYTEIVNITLIKHCK